jgi:hypothetical protein
MPTAESQTPLRRYKWIFRNYHRIDPEVNRVIEEKGAHQVLVSRLCEKSHRGMESEAYREMTRRSV